jgi:hypothetical protein
MSLMTDKPGYHLAMIEKGVLGESSKIMEELLELQDAEKQECKIMGLVELADLIGAVKHYLERHHPSIDLYDLETMAIITKRAFDNGRR